jgi:hypothetical protein
LLFSRNYLLVTFGKNDMENKWKISKILSYLLEIFLISVFMTAIMSIGMLMVRNPGEAELFKKWRSDFLLGCCIAIPAGYILVPSIHKLSFIMDKSGSK